MDSLKTMVQVLYEHLCELQAPNSSVCSNCLRIKPTVITDRTKVYLSLQVQWKRMKKVTAFLYEYISFWRLYIWPFK